MFSILIIDDREIFRRKFKRFPVFKKENDFSIKFEAQNGEEALEILRNNKVDVTITDIRMPIMDGLELLKEIKEDNLCGCVVLLSEYADFSYARQGLVLGAFDYIVKPIDSEKLDELLERVRVYLSQSNDILPTVGKNQIERLSRFILEKEPYAEKMYKDMVLELLATDCMETRIIDEINNILDRIKAEILKNREYLGKLIDTENLFTFNYCKREAIADNSAVQMNGIIAEVNKFNVCNKNGLIQSVCNTILKNVGKNISLQEIAELHFVNKAYLSHLFKQETGMSFVDYTGMVKMEYAKRRIESSDVKIYELSEELEYSDTEYFSKVFKQYTGTTPTAYRNLYRK